MKIVIAHMFPDLLNLYGDMGNIKSLEYRCKIRGIETEVLNITIHDKIDFNKIDIVFLGGGSDKEMEIVAKKLHKIQEPLRDYVEKEGTLVAICGGYQLLGKYYQLSGKKVEGLSILDIYTEARENRLIGNVVINSTIDSKEIEVAGFENHGGRTYINNHTPFGKVICGNGNNGEDNTEGVIYKNVIGTYLHGPLLPKNPKICDKIILSALTKKYGNVVLEKLDDEAENLARNYIIERCKNSSNGKK